MPVAPLVRRALEGELLPDGRVIAGAQLSKTGSSLTSFFEHGGRELLVGSYSGGGPPGGNVTQSVAPSLFGSSDRHEWSVLIWSVIFLLLLEALVLRKYAEGKLGHLAMVFFWVGVGLFYNAHYWAAYGSQAGYEWLLGYSLEWVLSVDNLLVFNLVIDAFKAPAAVLYKALWFGVLGAIFSRLIIFFALGHLVKAIYWVRFVFGFLLIISGIRALQDDDDMEPGDMLLVRGLKKCLGSRLHEGFDLEQHRFFIRGQDGRLRMTLLLPLILTVEATDIMFAMDSISAKVAQIHNTYATFSSSVFAVLGLRAAFFIVRDLVGYFELLRYGLCFILVFIGVQLLISDWYEMPPSVICAVIVVVFAVSMLASLCWRATRTSQGQGHDQRRSSFNATPEMPLRSKLGSERSSSPTAVASGSGRCDDGYGSLNEGEKPL